MEENGIRINKFLSEAGVCSRREADRQVELGNITIDGKVAETGARVLPGQTVLFQGKKVSKEEEMILIAFHKPVGIVCTAEKREKNNVIDYINYPKRIYPVGRLDKDSEGLLLLTNNGDIVNKMMRSGNMHEKEYIVTVNRPVTESFIHGLANGVPLAELNTMTRKCHVKQIGKKQFKIILTQGLNRQIRRMCEYFGYKVVTLKRVRIMNLYIDGLEEGKYREIRPEERKELEEMLFSEKSEKRTGGSHERIIHKKNEGAGRKAPGSVQGLLSGRQGDHVQRGVRRPVRHSERTGERNRDRSGRQSNR